MQTVNGVHFLSIAFFLLLFVANPAPAMFATYILPLASMYTSL